MEETLKAVNVEVSKDRVIIQPIVEENKTAAGIILTTDISNLPGKAVIVKVYDGPMDVKWLKPGDKVWYNKSNTLEIYFNGEKYLLTREVDIYCKTTDKEVF